MLEIVHRPEECAFGIVDLRAERTQIRGRLFWQLAVEFGRESLVADRHDVRGRTNAGQSDPAQKEATRILDEYSSKNK